MDAGSPTIIEYDAPDDGFDDRNQDKFHLEYSVVEMAAGASFVHIVKYELFANVEDALAAPTEDLSLVTVPNMLLLEPVVIDDETVGPWICLRLNCLELLKA